MILFPALIYVTCPGELPVQLPNLSKPPQSFIKV